jgi:hypothetical protein
LALHNWRATKVSLGDLVMKGLRGGLGKNLFAGGSDLGITAYLFGGNDHDVAFYQGQISGVTLAVSYDKSGTNNATLQLKSSGIEDRMKRIVTSMLISLAAVSLGGCGGNSWHQKLTVTVNTPKGEVSGSSVVGVNITLREDSFMMVTGYAYAANYSGEAVGKITVTG